MDLISLVFAFMLCSFWMTICISIILDRIRVNKLAKVLTQEDIVKIVNERINKEI